MRPTAFSAAPIIPKTPETFTASRVFTGTPDAIRTHDLQSRSLTLYPAELRARTGNIVLGKPMFVKGFASVRLDGSMGRFGEKELLASCSAA